MGRWEEARQTEYSERQRNKAIKRLTNVGNSQWNENVTESAPNKPDKKKEIKKTGAN